MAKKPQRRTQDVLAGLNGLLRVDVGSKHITCSTFIGARRRPSPILLSAAKILLCMTCLSWSAGGRAACRPEQFKQRRRPSGPPGRQRPGAPAASRPSSSLLMITCTCYPAFRPFRHYGIYMYMLPGQRPTATGRLPGAVEAAGRPRPGRRTALSSKGA